MREKLTDLIDSIPRIAADESPVEVQDGHFQIITDLPAQYVWPDVELDGKSHSAASPLVLITAPGAMGKSAAAHAIAARTRMPYVDLGSIRVGASTLTGEISKAVGDENYSAFMSALRAGTAALVLDGSDEAQLRVGRENYLAFIEDLAYLIRDAAPAQQIIMLGRRDSTETTLIALGEHGITPPVYRIAPLSHTQACALIDATLDSGNGRTQVHRQHPIPFGQLRDALFGDLAAALTPGLGGDPSTYWSEVEHFVGYPPVVVALAERLDGEENPRAALEALNVTPKSELPQLRGTLLRGVVEKILEREQQKVAARVGAALTLHPDDPVRSALYDVDEQALRLLNLTGTVGLHVDHPAVLDPADRDQYDRLIGSFLHDHPFISNGSFANSVFSDYVRAWAISSSLSPLYAENRAAFFASLPKTGPFFTHFLHALTADASGMGTLPEDLVDDALRSYGMGADIGGDSGTAAYVQREETALLAFFDPDQNATGPRVSFKVSELSGILTLTSPVARAVIVSEYGVVLRGVSGSFDLGPEVSIIADSIELEATSLTAIGGPEGDVLWNVISAREMKHSADLAVKALPTQSLAISWENPWHQWSSFETNLTADPRLPRQVSGQILVCVRRVLSSFKSSMVSDPSVSSEKMDRLIIGDNEVFKATFDALNDLGVVAHEGNLYRVSLDTLGRYGISWAALRGDDPAKVLHPLLRDISASARMDKFRSAD
ncbi:hypothetical protein [Microbacterium sp. JZ101]